MRTLCLALLLWLLPTCVMAAPGSIRACMENSDSPPWLLMSGEGIVQFHLKEVANRIGHPIILTPLPWKRCLSLVSQGQLDAAVKLSYSEERARTIGVYPMRHGAPDPAKRLLTESYSLYQPKGGQVRWDGRQLVAGGFLPEDAELRSLPDRKVVEFMQGIERQIGRKKIRFTPLAPNGTPYPPEL